MENSEDRCVSLLPDIFDPVAGHVSDGIFRQLSSTNPASLNTDNAFGNVVSSIQYRALADKANDAFYKLGNTRTPIQAYVFDVITASVQKLNLDDVFEQKNAIAKAVEEEFEMAMSAGYEIVQTLVVDIEPDGHVKWAMNEINAGGSQLLKSLESMEMKCVIAKNLKQQELQQPRSPSLEESQGVTKFAIEDGGYCITVQKNVTPEKVFAKLIDSNEEQHRRRCLVEETLETTMEKLKAVACQSLSWRKQLIATIEDSGKCSESSASDCSKGLVQQLLLQEAKIENSKPSSSRTNSSPTKETHVDQFSRGKRKASQSPEGDPCRQKASTSSSPPPGGSSSAGYHRSLNILYTKRGGIGQTCLSNKWKNGIKVMYQRLDSESEAAYYSGLLKRFWEGEGIIKECFTCYKDGSKDIVAVQRVEDFSTWLEDYLRKSTCQCYSTSIRKLYKEILMGIKCLHQEKVAHGNMKNGVGITFEGHAKLMLMKKYKKAFKDVAAEDFAGLEYFVKKINNFHEKYHGVIPPDAADFSEILKNPTSWEKSIWIYNHPFTYTARERILSVIRLSDFLWRNDLIDDLSKVMEPWTTFKDWPEKLIWGTPMHACLHHGPKLKVDGRVGALPRFIVNCQSHNQSKVEKNKNKGKDRYDAELEVFKFFPAVYVEFHKGLRILWEGRERKDPAERKIIRNFFKNEL